MTLGRTPYPTASTVSGTTFTQAASCDGAVGHIPS